MTDFNMTNYGAQKSGTRKEAKKKNILLAPISNEVGSTIEIVMLLVVTVGLVVIFKDQMVTFVNNLFTQIFAFNGI